MARLMMFQFLWLAVAALGCDRGKPATPRAQPPETTPAYSRSVITDPKLQLVAGQVEQQLLERKAGGEPVFSKVEILPVAQTTLPYGVGVNQQEPRLPIILTTGPGWRQLPAGTQETLLREIYSSVAEQLQPAAPGVKPTLTVQTPKGLLLAWINDLSPGRKLVHGDAD